MQRKHIEHEKQRAVAVVQQQMTMLTDELRRMNVEATGATEDLRANRLVGTIDLNFLAAHRRYMLATQRKATALMQKMAVVQKQLDEARLALGEAAKQRKIIEKLREKYELRWKDEKSRSELAEADDTNMRLSYASNNDA